MDEVGESLQKWNGHLKLEDAKLEELLEHLESIGVNSLEDLKYVKPGNLKLKGA